MAYTLTKQRSPNYDYSNAPRMIIVHHWGSDGQSFNAVVNWLCNRNAQVSAHYVLQDGKVCQLVEEKHKAWHCVGKNGQSIGIECRPECTAGDQQTLAELIANIWTRWGKLPVYGHKDFNNTACPGRYYSKLSAIVANATRIYNGEKPAPTPTPSTKKGLAIDGYFGSASVTAWQKWVGTVQDGVLSGQDTDDKKYVPAINAIEWGSGGSNCIRALQNILKKAGYNPGSIDGYIGKNTVTAWQRYITAKGYKVAIDGYFGTETAKASQRYLNKLVYGV